MKRDKKSTNRANEIVKNSLVFFLAIGLLFGFAGCNLLDIILSEEIDNANNYTEEEHLRRVSDLVEKRYMTDANEYTSFEVYPIYDEYEDLRYFVVDFEPEGYVYIYLNEKVVRFGPSMYWRCPYESEFWRPYTYAPGMECTVPDENGEMVTYHDICFKKDEEGNYYGFRVSHFKAANIKNEKRYLLQIYDKYSNTEGLVPVVKRDERYLNLVSWEEIEFYDEFCSENCVLSNISFIPKGADFGL